MKIKILIVSVAALAVSLCRANSSNYHSANDSVTFIHFESKAVNTSFIGNGVQWSAYPHADSDQAEWGALMTSDKWNMVFKRLDYMRPRMVRVMDQANWRYYKGLNNTGHPIVDFNNQEIKSLCLLLDYCERKGITVIIGEWGTPDNGKNPKGIVRADDPRWSEMICSFLNYLLNEKKYNCIKYYNLINEPNGSWASTDGDWEQWSSGYKMMYEALVKNKLSNRISLIGPDVVANYDHPKRLMKGSDWVQHTAKEFSDITSLYDIHSYASQDMVHRTDLYNFFTNIINLTKNNPRPFILGELGLKYKQEMGEEQHRRAVSDTVACDNDSQMFVYEYFYGIDITDALIQAMMAGTSSVIAWDLDDAMYTWGDTGDKHNLKRWGMWNSLGTEFGNPDDEKLRPWFYPWSLMCRYFVPGMSIYATSKVTTNGIRAIMGVLNGNYTIALLNTSEEQCLVSINADKKETLSLDKYVYSETNSPKDKDGLPKTAGRMKKIHLSNGIEIELPARSFILLTNLKR